MLFVILAPYLFFYLLLQFGQNSVALRNNYSAVMANSQQEPARCHKNNHETEK